MLTRIDLVIAAQNESDDALRILKANPPTQLGLPVIVTVANSPSTTSSSSQVDGVTSATSANDADDLFQSKLLECIELGAAGYVIISH